MEKKNVLLVHNFYQIGGGEHTVFENEKNMLLENGHKVSVYTRSNDELKTSKWKMLLLPLTTVWSFRTYFEVRKMIRQKNIQVVHCHNTFPLISPSVYYAARSLKIPVIQTIHNFRFLCPNGLFYCNGRICEKCRETGSFLPAIKNGCYRDSKLQTAVVAAMLKIHRWLGTYRKINYIFLTEFNRDKFYDLIDIKSSSVFVKPNFVSEPGPAYDRKNESSAFVFAGRLEKSKGIDFLLDVWPELPDEYELHIYGDGEYRNTCELAADKFRNIYYYGFTPQSEIFLNLKKATALLFPSDWYEGYPMILAESFAMSTPVVAVSIGNHGDIATHSGGGATFAPRNEEEFRNALENVMTHNADYSHCARSFYEENLSKQKNYEKLREIYEQAVHIS